MPVTTRAIKECVEEIKNSFFSLIFSTLSLVILCALHVLFQVFNTVARPYAYYQVCHALIRENQVPRENIPQPLSPLVEVPRRKPFVSQQVPQREIPLLPRDFHVPEPTPSEADTEIAPQDESPPPYNYVANPNYVPHTFANDPAPIAPPCCRFIFNTRRSSSHLNRDIE
ncbi:hypothetical protein V9T40_001308 [Parthenolecanium corni]|uniref:Uncharacterized protein n=1 Tax=Parthenolecanium corni TaxID=536013 RepID=A0AAN9Y185_9HEMI